MLDITMKKVLLKENKIKRERKEIQTNMEDQAKTHIIKSKKRYLGNIYLLIIFF